jgi:GNAT superfamily N-acetyltransferase
MTIHIKELSSADLGALERHFLALGNEDRRLRFGIALNDWAIQGYVQGIDFGSDAVFGVLDDELNIVAAVHLACSDGRAELGMSVSHGHRGQGIGDALFRRARLHARNKGVTAIFIHCLAENAAMMHLARKQGMDMVTEYGEAEAWLGLAPADASSHASSMFEQGAALFDYALKNQVMKARRVVDALTGGLAQRATTE